MSPQHAIKSSAPMLPVTATVSRHHNLIELLQTQFGSPKPVRSCGRDYAVAAHW